VLGAGAIGKRFAIGLKQSEHGYFHGVASKSADRARTLVADVGGGQVYEAYEALLKDPNVHAVYVALPHHLHEEWTIKAVEAGKHVLCEKPFALDARQAANMVDAALLRNKFCMEAFMYRCHPQTEELRNIIRAGAIGRPVEMQVSFGFNAPPDWDNFRTDAALGGGALLDVGCYCVSLARWVAGSEPVDLSYEVERLNGYDAYGSGRLGFASGFQVSFECAIHRQLENKAVIRGEEGRIEIPSPWFCDQPIRLYRSGYSEPEMIRKQPPNFDLYANEADVVALNLEQGEAPQMTWNDTIGNMRALDRLRESAGLIFESVR
jgi:predicted dehydrogenase